MEYPFRFESSVSKIYLKTITILPWHINNIDINENNESNLQSLNI